MKAVRLTKITTGLRKYSLVMALLGSGLGIACGAQAPGNGLNPGAQPNTAPSQSAPDLDSLAPSAGSGAGATSPQLQAAIDRVTKAKADLDLAHKRLNASKAILKAADAEFKAAKADQQAIALKGQAQELADATGMSERTPPGTTVPGQTAPAQPASVQPTGADQSAENAGQNFDFSGTPFTGVPSPGK